MARQLTLEILGDASKMAKSLQDAGHTAATFGDKVRDAGKKMSAFVTVPVVAFLGAATKAGVEDAAAQSKLAQTLKSVAAGGAGAVAIAEKQIAAMQRVSTFTDDELRPAYENVVRATGSVMSANELMASAMDLAAAKGIPLADASMALAKAHEGNYGALNKLIPGLVDVKDKSLEWTDVQKTLNTVVGGQAAAATTTAAGKAAMLKRDIGELTESIGAALLPILQQVIPIISSLAAWFTNLPGPAKAVIGVVVGLAAVIGPLVGVVTALGAAFTFIAANPVVLIIAAVAALAVGLVVAYQKVEWFRNAVNAVFDWIKDYWPLLAGILLGPIGLAIGLIVKNFDSIKGVVQSVWDFIRPILSQIAGAVSAVAGPLGKVAGAIGGAIGHLPGFATGGIVPGPLGSPQLAVIHGGEEVIPRHRVGAGGGNVTIINVAALDPAGAATAVVRAIDEYESRNGTRYARAS